MNTQTVAFWLVEIGAVAAVLTWLGGILVGIAWPGLRESIGCGSAGLLAWLGLCILLALCVRPVEL